MYPATPDCWCLIVSLNYTQSDIRRVHFTNKNSNTVWNSVGELALFLRCDVCSPSFSQPTVLLQLSLYFLWAYFFFKCHVKSEGTKHWNLCMPVLKQVLDRFNTPIYKGRLDAWTDWASVLNKCIKWETEIHSFLLILRI